VSGLSQGATLEWKAYSTPPMRAVTGRIAQGERWNYMITRRANGDDVLSRWPRRGVITLEDIRMAAATAVEVTGWEQGKEMAAQFERGESIRWAPGWTQPPPEQRERT
jgi:hypothetical protein